MSWNEINQKLQEIKTFQFKEDTIPDEGEDSKGRYYKRIEIGTGNDITNNTYGRLTAIFPVKENNVCFKREYRFDDCKNKKRLPFDFAIFNEEGILTRLVEYDGQQHYKKNDYFGGEEGFKQTQLCDKIKNEYCLQNNIPLVRIPYTEKNITIEKILGDEYLIHP